MDEIIETTTTNITQNDSTEIIPTTQLIDSICNNIFFPDDKPPRIGFVMLYFFNQIDIIDELRVSVVIETKRVKKNLYSTKIVIYPSNLTSCPSNMITFKNVYETNEYCSQNMNNCVEKCIIPFYAVLPYLKFNKYRGEFIDTKKLVNELLNDKYLGGDVCPVCLCKTTTKIKCRHTLCIPCLSKMTDVGDYKCPLCRAEIYSR